MEVTQHYDLPSLHALLIDTANSATMATVETNVMAAIRSGSDIGGNIHKSIYNGINSSQLLCRPRQH